MALNSNTSYLQYWEDFSLLGKSMNRYAIATFISMAVSILGGIIIEFIFIVPMMGAMGSGTIDDPYSMITRIGVILLVFTIIALAFSIYQFVTYIQYLMHLKKVGEYSGDFDLQKAYKMELWAMIISFIMTFIFLPAMFIFSFTGDYLNNINTETELYSFFILIFGFIFGILFIAIISIILQIISVLAFDRWGQNINRANQQNPYARSIAEGTNFMKLGRIIALFAGSIGSILYLIGLMKAGKNMIGFFNGYGNQQLSQGAALPPSSSSNTFQQPGSSTTNPSLNSSYMGNTSNGNTTMKPQGEGFCPFCGSKLEDKRSMFCSKCGRKLI